MSYIFPLFAIGARIATVYGLDFLVSIYVRSKSIFFISQLPDRLWSPHSLLYNGYRG
jgi:hypothetical protein